MLALIFDLDGTLWDSTQTIANAWNSYDNRFKFSANDVKAIAGLSREKIFLRLFPDFSNEKIAEISEAFEKLENEFLIKQGGIIYSGVQKLIPKLARKHKLFIVSNCQSGYIELFLKHAKLADYFTDFECYGNNLKPKFENIKAIVDRNNLKRAYYIGDTIWDLESAEKAKIPFIYSAYGFGKIENKNPQSIENFEDLEKLVTIL